MNDSRRDKHVVMLVANDVSRDSRVQKTALTASQAGYRVTVIGMSRTDQRSVEQLGAASVVRVPVPFELFKAAKQRPAPQDRISSTLRRIERLAVSRAEAGQRRLGLVNANPTATGGSQVRLQMRRLPLHAGIKAHQLAGVATGALRRLWGRRTRPQDDFTVEARRRRAKLLDFERAYLAELATMEFDLMHAHDFLVISCARSAVGISARAGRRPRFVYDAHEYVRGLAELPSGMQRVNVAMEQENIKAADAILTVSPVLADRLQHDHALAERPGLVLNAPLASTADETSPLSVREAAGVPEGVPLMVYGGAVKPARGIKTVVEALPLLPGVHLAIVVSTPDAGAVKDLLGEAQRLGCADRVRLVPYVEHDQVINYLRTADIGVHPLLRSGNAELAWPNKIFEYLHARIPMVVSDMPSMSALVTQHGWGEVFPAGEPQGFAAAVRRVLEHPGDYQAALSDPTARERFSWEEQGRRLVETYDRLLLADQDAPREPIAAPSPS